MRRYINCFDPNPRLELPKYDWLPVEVDEEDSVPAPLNGQKPTGNDDNKTAPNSIQFEQSAVYKLVPISWDMEALWDLYVFTMWMKTPSVCDMVVDKWIEWAKVMDEHKKRRKAAIPQYTKVGPFHRMARLKTPKPEELPDFHDLFDIDLGWLNLLWKETESGAKRFWKELLLTHTQEAKRHFERYSARDFSPAFLHTFALFALQPAERRPSWQISSKLSQELQNEERCNEYHEHGKRVVNREDTEMVQCYKEMWTDWVMETHPLEVEVVAPWVRKARKVRQLTQNERRKRKVEMRERARAGST